VIELTGIRLAERQSVWLHAFPVGTYHHPQHGELKFTPARLERIAGNIRNRARGIDLAVDFEHGQDPAKGKRAAGWITTAEVRDDGLWLEVVFTTEARAEIRGGAWRYLSPEFLKEWAHPRTGQVFKDVLLGAALTNRPFLKDLQAVAATEPTTMQRGRVSPLAGLAGGSAFDQLVQDLAGRTGTPVETVAREVSRLIPDAYKTHREL
jgi:hypothetical protein